MNILDFVRDYLTNQDEAMKKLITFFLNLVMESELEQICGYNTFKILQIRIYDLSILS